MKKKRTMQEPKEEKRQLPLDRLICDELAVWTKWDRYRNHNDNRGATYGKLFQRIHVHQRLCGELEFQTALATLQGRGVIVEQGGCYRLCGAEDRVAPNLNEEDGEEDRAINNATGTNYSELVEEDAPAAATTTQSSTLTHGTLRTQNGRGSPSNTWNLTPVSLFIRTLGFLDNTTLMIMCLVCQQIRDIIWTGHGMETKFLRVFELSPSNFVRAKPKPYRSLVFAGRSRVRDFLSHMHQYFQTVTTTRLLHGMQHWQVHDIQEFHKCVNLGYHGMTDYIRDEEFEGLTRNITMPGIVSLDMSSLLPMEVRFTALYRAIACMVPNLHELDISHNMYNSELLEFFAERCPRLELIRWNYNVDRVRVYLNDADGYTLQSMNNLKELYFDNHCFGFSHNSKIDENGDIVDDDDDDDGDSDIGVTEFEAMSDSNNHSNIFFFHGLRNNPLERISIRNARYLDPDRVQEILPQSILMKFVRKAPATLVWFRSDLSSANIRILQSERPGIQFLN